MLSMSVEHANQLRQLIVEKYRSQPAGIANIIFNHHLLQPVYNYVTQNHFPSSASWQAWKIFKFYETASACHITPLGHLERPREGYKSMTKPASGTFTNSTALRPSQGLHLATDHEYTLTSSSIFNHRRRHQTSKGFSLRISSVFIII